MRFNLRVLAIFCAMLASATHADASLTLDYVSNQNLTTGTFTGYSNAQALDLSTGRFVVLGYGGTAVVPTCWYYDAETGQPAEPYRTAFTPMPRSNGVGTLTNFAGTIKDGRLYYYDSSTTDSISPAGGQIGLLETPDAATATAASPLSSQLFARNMAITGDGENTWIGTVGEGNYAEARCRLFKATDASANNFTEQGVIAGAALATPGTGKAGVGFAPPAGPGLPPEWIATADIQGGVNALRLWHRTGTDADPDFGYTMASQIPRRCVDVKFHIARTPDETSVVIALMRPQVVADNAGEIIMYSFPDGQLKEISRLVIPYALAPKYVADRGSVNIDEANHLVYASWNDFYITGDGLNRFTLVRARYSPVEIVDLTVASSLSASVTTQYTTVTATHHLKNNGTLTATNVQLALGSTFAMSNIQCSSSAATINTGGPNPTVTIPTLAGGEEIVVTVDVSSNVPGQGVVTAAASLNETDANPGDNSTTLPLEFVRVSDMSCSLIPSGGSYFANNGVNMQIHVRDATAAPIAEPFAVHVTFSRPVTLPGQSGAPVSSLDLSGEIAVGQTDYFLPLDFFVPSTHGPLVITAVVTATNGDGNPLNNTATATLEIVEVTDLSVNLVPDSPTLRNGDATSITAYVHNGGGSALAGATLHETVGGAATLGFNNVGPCFACGRSHCSAAGKRCRH